MAQVLRHLPPHLPNPDLLVGIETSDDAGVFRLTDELALVQSVDFFTPIVDDPYEYGRIAAANALSDIWAMGATPLTALNLVGFPVDKVDGSVLAEILRGGAETVAEAGVTLVGGHSIDDAEPKYGLAVTGTVHPDRIWRNSGAQVGDVLVLTKPIGIGAITTGIKNDTTSAEVAAASIAVMTRLNRDAYQAAQAVTVHAATDVTGYGLLGHALEMARGSQVGLQIRVADVPVLDGARELIERGVYPGGTKKNLAAVREFVDFAPAVSEVDQVLLCDAVTSGGLLLAVPAEQLDTLLERLAAAGTLAKAVIGEVVSDRPAGTIAVT